MIVFLDTSVIVSACIADHEHHWPSLQLVASCTHAHSRTAAHCLAETYCNLTRMPRGLRTSGHEAGLYLRDLRDRVAVVALDGDEYADAIQAAADLGLAGAVIYDLLIARCALKAGAEVFYTWNTRDFDRLGPEIASLVRTPPQAS